MQRFRTIVITSPDDVRDEAAKITRLLQAGVDLVHIRKPDASARDVRNLIEEIPIGLRSRLRLHGHFALCDDFNLAGVHLNSRNPKAPASALGVSRSCHALEELTDAGKYDYVTLSPIYDSISKQGYTAAFSLDRLKGRLPGNVIALGGVTPDKFQELRQTGFAGAALLGYIWDGDFELSLKELARVIEGMPDSRNDSDMP